MLNEFSIIVATDEADGIGKENSFRKTTTFTQNSNKINAIIMGCKTWESLPVTPSK